MTQEEKVKAYDEARKKIAIRFGSNVADEIFSQFEMSEDERIRKALINGFNKLDKSAVWYNGITNSQILAWLEKQGEEKLADKVEPKFHESDWVIDKQGIVHQIANVIKNVTYNTYGYDIVGGGYFNDNTEGVRLWTIQDAKDGDVLADDIGVILFKSIRDNNVINYYAYLSGLFAVQDGEKYWGSAVNCTLSPATKEQRERFFAAMHDAGYKWNAEKKELKKIEPKPTDEEMKELLRTEYEKGRADVIAEMQKPWSEEDKEMLEDTCRILSNSKECTTSNVRWLKSLRPQSHWKPSDEQIKAIKWVMDGDNPENWSVVLKNLYQDLKKLKE